MSELKPCPFCGGKAELKQYGAIKWYFVKCRECKAGTVSHFDKNVVIEAWNRRANDEQADC